MVTDEPKSAEGEAKPDGAAADGAEGEESDEAPPNKMFKVRIRSAEPKQVKISKKNVCFVSITQGSGDNDGQKQAKLIKFFMSGRDQSFSAQFRHAVMLGP